MVLDNANALNLWSFVKGSVLEHNYQIMVLDNGIRWGYMVFNDRW